MPDEIELYLQSIKIQNRKYQGLTELGKHEILSWFNSGKQKNNFVEPYVIETTTISSNEIGRWKEYRDKWLCGGWPVVTNLPERIVFIVMDKNVKVTKISGGFRI